MADRPFISAVIPITDGRYDGIEEVYYAYKKALNDQSLDSEFIYVLDGAYPEIFAQLKALRENGEDVKIIKFAQWFGESAALSMGFENASGEILLSLPAYYQVEPEELVKVIEALDENSDMIIGRRNPRSDSIVKRAQTWTFHFLLRLLTQFPFRDLGCSVRAIKKKVMEEVQIYGDLHRFLPVLAYRQGFRVKEIELKQSRKNSSPVIYAPGIYLRRLLDILTVLFVVKFTKKPLRFFGLLGTTLFGIGALTGLALLVQRVFFHMALADRPIILVPALLLTLGVQFFAIGLIGEILIFTHANQMKEYTVEEIVN